MNQVFKRREFITLLGGAAAAWPLAAGAQQAAMPVVGILSLGPTNPNLLTSFRKGLSEMGFVEGRNVAIEMRSADNNPVLLPDKAADLARRRPNVIAALALSSVVLAAKTATATTPIVFTTGEDPVQSGLVSSLNRPGGNITGIASMAVELGPKRLGLLHELKPGAMRFAALVNPNSPTAEANVAGLRGAGSAIGVQLDILMVATPREIEPAFANLAQKGTDALVIGVDQMFGGNRGVQLATLAARHAVPAIHWMRAFSEVGGLMSYGMSVPEQYRLAGIYVGRVLKGEKPADLPVMQPTKFELVINLQTARAIGIEVPPTLLAIADEVIE